MSSKKTSYGWMIMIVFLLNHDFAGNGVVWLDSIDNVIHFLFHYQSYRKKELLDRDFDHVLLFACKGLYR